LAEMALHGEFESLHTLGLSSIEKTPSVQVPLNLFLENLNHLQQLVIEVPLAKRHWILFCVATVEPSTNSFVSISRDDESHFPLIVFSGNVIQRIADQCPNLEEVELPID